MTPSRDPTTGRFLKPSVEERVTAHVTRINELQDGLYPDAFNVAHIPPRPIPIEYDKPGNFLTDNWLWLTPIALALVGLVVYLVR